MSKLNMYAKQLDDIARASFDAFRKAETAYNKAEARAKEFSKRVATDTEYMVKATRAEADLLEAKAAYDKALFAFRDSDGQFASIRRELEAAISDVYSVDPAALDLPTLELIKSGILKGAEYVKLLRKAQNEGNPTMVRLIGKYAGDAVQEITAKKGQHDPEATALRMALYESNHYTGGDRLAIFDELTMTYRRCVKNPRLIDRWDELTGEAVNDF